MKEKNLVTTEDLLKRAKNHKKESPEEFERKLKEFEAIHGNKYKGIAEHITTHSLTLNSLSKSIGRTQEVFKSIRTSSLMFSKMKSCYSGIEKASSLIKIANINFSILPQIDWDKVNAYVLIEELETEGIDPKIIKDIDIKLLSEIIKETKKIKLSLANIIKHSSEFEDELSYETLLSIITDIKAEIKSLKRKEMIINIAQEYINNEFKILIPENLRPREIEVFKLLMTGKSNKLIADALKIKESTVEKHINSILKTTGCSDRKEVLVKYRR